MKHINLFSTQLQGHNSEFDSHWDSIERDLLGLLENNISSRPENQEQMVGYLKTLKRLQAIIGASKSAVMEMKEASLNNLGMERTLNQSIRFLDDDLKTYLAFMDTMSFSIDKIIGKSKFVVGEIDFSDIGDDIDFELALLSD